MDDQSFYPSYLYPIARSGDHDQLPHTMYIFKF